MTTTDTRDTTPDGSPRDHWTAHYSGDLTKWSRHTWPVDAAEAGLVKAYIEGVAPSRSQVVDGDEKTVAYLVDAAVLETLERTAIEFEESAQQPATMNLHPALHGPLAGDDNLLMDTDDLKESIAHALALINLDAFGEGRDKGITRDDVTAERERIRHDHSSALIGASVELAMKVQLWPDGNGVVPVRSWTQTSETLDSPRTSHETWSLAYAIDGVRGLYVKGGVRQFFGETWRVVTGSGYQLRDGFEGREYAEGFARALVEAAPGIDFRVFTTPVAELPEDLRGALMGVYKAWGPFGEHKATETPA